MKFFAITTLFLALGVNATTQYSPNSGTDAPGTITDTTSSSSIIDNSSDPSANAAKTDEMNTGMNAQEMNTAPTDTPVNANESDTFGKTLSSGDIIKKGGDRQAQEDKVLDYSTAPNKKPLETEDSEESEETEE